MVLVFSLLNLSLISFRDWVLKSLGFEGNVVVSMIVNICFSLFIPYLILLTHQLKLWDGMNKIRNGCSSQGCCTNWKTIELEGDVVKKNKWENYTTFGKTAKSILYYISNLNLKEHCGLSHLKEIIHNDYEQSWPDVSQDSAKVSNAQYMVNQSYKFLLRDNIWCSVSNTTTELGEDKKTEGVRVSYIIRIYSHILSLGDLVEFLDGCVKSYTEYLDKKNNEQYFLSIKNADKKLIWNKFIFKSNRTFENMYMSNKSDILSQINFFIENKDYYIKRGIPYTLGLLFYGEPGTGKTSFIKALANKLSRHIIEIPLKKIRSCESLYEAFYTQNLTGLSLKFNEKIIVLEDIDAMDDLVKRRVSPVNPIENTSVLGSEDTGAGDDDGEMCKNQVDLSSLFSSFLKNPKAAPRIKDISLSFLLNLIEGILEMDGRIIIMTTNHIDKIDPALIRPGRIDMKIHFKLLSTKDINDMVKFYIPMWKPLKLKKTLKLSQAQLMNIIITCREDVNKITLKLMDSN